MYGMHAYVHWFLK
jgi:hypothetical protein